MSESDPTGYRESTDTIDGPVVEDQTEDDAPEASATLTTDEQAQRDDSVTRPGNAPD